MPPTVIFGDIRFPYDNVRETLKEVGITRLDTAARYQNGESERRLGQAGFPKDFTVDTKILYTPPGDGTLSAEAIEKSLTNSLQSLGIEKVNVLYCHAPDFTTPVAEQAKAFNVQYQKGRFSHLGVSNFMPEMVQEWLDIANKEGHVKPTVYQGQYNLLCRSYETTLFPLLRKNGMSFAAYSPLAGGFLNGNFTPEGGAAPGSTRFGSTGGNPNAGPYLGWYDKPSMHEAIRSLRALAEQEGVGMDELSLRWLVHHSALQDDDVIILGASKVEHISGAMGKIKKGPLSDGIADKLTQLWEVCKEDGMGITVFDQAELRKMAQPKS